MSTLNCELGYLARHRLSVILDHESPVKIDWMGLADRMDYTYGMINALKRERSPTLTLLEKWEKTAGSEANITTLMSLLDSIGCKEGVDILEEERAKKLRRMQADDRVSQFESPQPSQGSSSCSDDLVDSSSMAANDLTTFVKKQKYDVFLSYAEEDSEFAEEMRMRLIRQAKLRVFIPSDGLMTGEVFHREMADMIKQGCRKTIIILSPDYIKSPWCNYEANLALVACPDASRHVLIPVLYRKCEIPAFLTPLYYSDYPRHQNDRDSCEEYFWKKLYRSVKYVPSDSPPSWSRSRGTKVTATPPKEGRMNILHKLLKI